MGNFDTGSCENRTIAQSFVLFGSGRQQVGVHDAPAVMFETDRYLCLSIYSRMGQTPALFHFPSASLGLYRGQFEKLMGYEEGQSPEPLPGLIEEVLSESLSLLEPRGGYLLLPVEALLPEEKQVRLGQLVLSVHKTVFQQLRKSEQVALFQCTVGEQISRYASAQMESGDMLKGYLADMIGSVAADAAMDLVQESLRQEMELAGLRITNRYSPGYCGWNVAEQQILFSFFPPGFSGISLSDSSLMHPIKSVSGIIGIGKEVKMNPYTCEMCDMKNCIYKDRR